MKALLWGDVCPTEVTAPLFKEKDINALFTDAVSLFKGNGFNFVNLECALTESDTAIKKFGPNLKAPAQTAEVLKELGVHCCGLSNNHIFDYGCEGVADTIAALKKADIKTTGFVENYEDSRKNLVIEKQGERITVIAVCEHEYSYALENRMGSRPFDEYDTIEDISKAKEKSDRVIVIYHGGKEFCRYPSPRLYKLCRAMVRNGADIVLCQHSHCIGSYERYQNGHILYGQGNFHFVKPHGFEGWHTGLAVKYDTVSNKIEFVPLKTTERGITLAKGAEKAEILESFEQRNQKLLNGEWKTEWHNFCMSVKDNYLGVIGNTCTKESTQHNNDNFGHFLDCEAHTDVWRELFPSYNLTNCLE